MRLLRRSAVVVALATVVLLCWPSSADAHAYLDHSNPADGATIATAPETLRLAFSEHVVLSATTIQLLDAEDRPIPLGRVRLVTDEPGDTEAPAEIVADLPPLPKGAYRLTWSTLSSDDLHRTSGVIAFGVRTTVAGGGVHAASPDPLEAIAGTALLAGAALLLGAPLALHTLRAAPPGRRRRIRRAAILGGQVAIAATLVGPVRQVLAGDAEVLLAGGYAARWATRTVGLALLVHGVRADGRRVSLVAGAALTVIGQTLLGHAMAQASSDALRIPVTALHLLATLGWVGAVAGIAIGLGPRPHATAPGVGTALRRFAAPAGTCLAIAALTGAWLASDVVVSVDALVVTSYGRTLLLKLAIVALAGTLALANHRRLRNGRDPDLPSRTIRAEAIALGGILTATALLLAGQPATEPQLVDTGPAASAGPAARQVADLEETVSVRPNHAGPSSVLVGAFDRRRPAAGPISGVTVRVGHRDLGSASALGDGHWSAPVPDLPSGPTRITVTVSRPGVRPVVTSYRWVVGPATRPPAVVVSRAPLAPALRIASGAMVVVIAGTVLVLRRRARRGEETLAGVPVGDAETETVSATSP